MLKFVLTIEGESNRKLPKMIASKKLINDTQKKFNTLTDLIKKDLTQCVKNRCNCGH